MIFSDGGWSVPALDGNRGHSTRLGLTHPLWVAFRLMASAAHGNQVSVLNPCMIQKKPAERQMGEPLDMFDVMNHDGCIGSATDLAVPVVVRQDGLGKFAPLKADVKRVDITRRNQAEQPCQEAVSHRQNKKSPRAQRLLYSWALGLYWSDIQFKPPAAPGTHHRQRRNAGSSDRLKQELLTSRTAHLITRNDSRARTGHWSSSCCHYTTAQFILQIFFDFSSAPFQKITPPTEIKR